MKALLPGARFGRLTVVELLPARKRHGVAAVRCDCGAERTVLTQSLRSGATRSCGCLYRETRITSSQTHGGSHGPTYNCWRNMRQRCLNPSTPSYRWYGARGITICARWDSFENFLADMGEKPEGLSLDRIDSDGAYEPANCRWATRKQQSENQRRRGSLAA